MRERFRWITRSLQSKFMISVSMLLVCLMGIVTVAVDDRLRGLLLREARQRANAIAHAFGATTSNALLNYDYVALSQAAEKAVKEEGIAYVIVLDKEGNVAAHSARPELLGMDLAAASPGAEWIEAEGGARPIMEVTHAVLVEGSDVQWGTVRVGLGLDSMQGEIVRIRWILLVIGLCGVALALLGSRVISRGISARVAKLVDGTIAVSKGDLDHRIQVDSEDEISTLAQHFNYMTEQIRKQQTEIAIAKRELEVLNATLEDKVARRTQEFFASEEKYRILVDNSPDPILISQGGLIRFVNPAFERVFGYELGGMVRESLFTDELFHAEDRGRVTEYLGRIQSGDPVEVGEVRGVTKEGGERVFELRGMRIHYLGEPALELILADTTEKRELQDHLLQHEKLRALGELASGVAHDFNNILGIILGRSQLLQHKVDDEIVRKGLRTIERAAMDGGETVRRIQDFARARTETDFHPIDLNALLEEVVEITRTRWKDEAEVRNVQIDVTLDLTPVSLILGTASELREVYTNLIFNAVDAMPGGGRISIHSQMDDGHTAVRVTDDGQGMDEAVRARIFDPFFTTKGTKGMGLGMSVVYGIIERHGGKIVVESELGKGTCFTIRIPEATDVEAGREEEKRTESEGPARILVVDDEHEILELVSDILGECGHTVRTASSGPEGLALFEKESFDLMFCDLGMRDMSGWEVVRAVRSIDKAVGVVLLTGWGATLSEAKVEDHGIDAVMNKPFEMAKLLATIDRVMEGRSARSAT